MRGHRIVIIALLLLLAPGCAPRPFGPGGPYPGQPGTIGAPRSSASSSRAGFLILRVSAREYAPGLPVYLLLINRSNRMVYYNPCNAQIERQADGRWDGEALRGPGACAPMNSPVPANGFVRHEIGLPAELSEGRYRFRLELDGDDLGAQTTLLSNAFRIR